MKRATCILVAALLVLLICPSTHLFAKSYHQGDSDGPVVIPPSSNDDQPIDFCDGDDDGDADTITGFKGKKQNGAPPTMRPGGVIIIFKMWWNLVIWVR